MPNATLSLVQEDCWTVAGLPGSEVTGPPLKETLADIAWPRKTGNGLLAPFQGPRVHDVGSLRYLSAS